MKRHNNRDSISRLFLRIHSVFVPHVVVSNYNMKVKRRNILARFAAAILRRFLYLYPALYVYSNRLNIAVMRQSFKRVNQSNLLQFWHSFDFAVLPSNNYKHFGDQQDGGYFLATPIEQCSEVVSIGIGDNLSFDQALSPFVSRIHMFDHTIEVPVDIPINAIFHEKGLGISCTEELLDLQAILELTKPESPKIVKIDIEGAEWAVLGSLKADALVGISQLIIEFHDLIRLIRVPETFESVLKVLEFIKKDFWAVNLNPNNWANSQIIHGVVFSDVLEVTFLNKRENREIVQGSMSMRGYPNNPGTAHLLLGNFPQIFR